MGQMTLRSRAWHSFPAFIWIYLISMGLSCTRCTAQTRLPEEVDIDRMKILFCNNCLSIHECRSTGIQMCPLCQQICKSSEGQYRRCWTESENNCEPTGTYRGPVCGYQDAVICQARNNTYCVFWHCATSCPPTVSQQPNSQCFSPRPPPTQVNIMSTEDGQSTSTGSTTSGKGGGGGRRGPSASTIALACVLSIVLLLVILGAGLWYLRRRGKLPAFMKKTRNPNESAIELEARAAKRAPIPTPPALGSAEYSYAYGQRPDNGGAKPMNQDEDEYHNYYSLDKDGGGKDSARYVTDGPGTAKSPSAEAPNDHDYFVLEKSDESHAQDGGHNPVGLPPENSDDDHTYFPLQKTPELPSGNANSGYEVAKTAPTGGSEGEDASSPYNRLDRGEDKQTDEGALSDDYQHLKDN